MKRKILSLIAVFVLMALVLPPGLVKASDSITVNLSPNATNVANKITVNLTLANAYVGANTQIEILIDGDANQSQKFSIPTAVSTQSVYTQVGTGAAEYVSSASISTSPVTLAKSLIIRTGINVNISPNTPFAIVIDTSANFVPLTTGTHTIQVTVSGNYVVSGTFSVATAQSGSAVTISSINIGNPKLGQTSTYEFFFVPGLALVTGDSISVEFPQGFNVPPTIDGRNFALIQGSAQVGDFTNNVVVSQNVVKLTIPPTQFTFNAGYSTKLVFGLYTGIVNPNTAGQYTFKLWTSKQPTPATYTVTLGTSITNLVWDVNPKASGAYGEHNISFKTSSAGALTTSDTITIQFPSGFVLPSQVPSGSVLVNNTVAKASVSSNSLVITCPVAIDNASQVSIKITTDAKIQNPSPSQTGYKIKVFTSQDQLAVESNSVVITPSTLQNVSVTVSPQVVGKNATITISFLTGLGGALSPNDSIYISFPSQFSLPSTIANNLVTITYNNNNYNPASVTVTKGTGTVSLTLPSNLSIQAGSSVKIAIDGNASIQTPQTAGTFTLKLSTSKETTPVDSNQFTIFAYPKSLITVTPNIPDGQNGYYLTQPKVTFAIQDILGVTPTLYYKINDGNYQTYDLVNKPSISIPEGKTTLTYYATDNFGNKEPENTKVFLVDLTDPVISITDPKENSVVVQPTFTIKGSVKSIDIANTSLFVEGKSVTLNSDGSFEALITLPNEGVNTITLQAKSPSGRTSTKQFAVNYIARVTIFLQVGNDNAYINGEQVKIDAPPFILGGNVMVPLRFILTSFKANLDWDSIFQIITLTLGSNRVRLQIGNLRADVNGQLKMLPTAPVLIKGVTFVPLRFISENFGADVKWDGTLKAVSIVYPKP